MPTPHFSTCQGDQTPTTKGGCSTTLHPAPCCSSYREGTPFPQRLLAGPNVHPLGDV